MDENFFEENGYLIFKNLANVVEPVRKRLFQSLGLRFSTPSDTFFDEDKLANFIISTYKNSHKELMDVYSVLDRTPEMVALSVNDSILDCVKKAKCADPLLSSYPTWRIDVAHNRPERWFPWHQENYHDRFSNSGVTVWIPLLDVGADKKSSTIFVKPGSHKYGTVKYGKGGKFDIVDERVSDMEEVPVELPYGGLVVFSNYLVHRSGIINDPYGIRLSIQLRYDDMSDAHYRSIGWQPNFRIIDAYANVG